jgi:hypothetical protein
VAVGLFDWLFGKKEKTATLSAAHAAAPAPSAPARPPAAPPIPPPVAPPRPAAPPLSAEEENLRRWRESGEARAWVEARKGRWDHQDWLALLESLRRSRYWPLRPESVGLVLEEVKRDWLAARG